MINLLIYVLSLAFSLSAIAKEPNNTETTIGVAQPNGGDFESSKVSVLFVNNQALLQRWSDSYSLAMSYRLGFGGFSDKNIAYLISVPTKIRYTYPIEKSGWTLLTEGGFSVQVLHLVTNIPSDKDQNQTDFRWKSSLDGVISLAFSRSDGDMDSTLGFEYSTQLFGGKNWRNFNGKDIVATKAPTGLAAIHFAISHKFD